MSSLSRKKVSSITFSVINAVLLLIVSFTMLYPFWNLLVTSVTPADVDLTNLRLIPTKVDFAAYEKILRDSTIFGGFTNTIARTALGTVMTIIVTFLMAYPLSKNYLPNKKLWTGLIVFTMYFQGGMIPSYLLVKSLNLIDTIWALVLPHMMNIFHLIIVRNFLMSFPQSIEESARIDGANEYLILFRIVLPLSLPILATLVLWTVVYHWNAWFDAMIYIQTPRKQVMQIIMRQVVNDSSSNMLSTHGTQELTNPENIKAAVIMLTTFPILLSYPFLQKYFVKGMMAGGVKG